jgi:hypothetical protein
MPSVPALVSRSRPPSEPTPLFEHLLDWLIENAPLYIMIRQWSGDPRGGLASYLASGGALEAIGYDIITGGRDLVRDTVTYVLRPWIEALIAGPAYACWIDSNPNTGAWYPVVGAAQLRALIPADHLLSVTTLEPLLRAIHAGVIDFNGKRHRVRVQIYHPETVDEAIGLLLDQGERLGSGGLSQTEFCQRVVDLCGVARGSSGFGDSTILHKAYELQGNRG